MLGYVELASYGSARLASEALYAVTTVHEGDEEGQSRI